MSVIIGVATILLAAAISYPYIKISEFDEKIIKLGDRVTSLEKDKEYLVKLFEERMRRPWKP
jgi:hypothetical protein